MRSIFKDLLDSKLVRILRLLLKNKDKLFHLYKISQEANVPLGSSFRIVRKLVKLKVLDVIIVGKLKLYRLSKNQLTEDLELLSNHDTIYNRTMKKNEK